jgi:hypothetical protein
VQNRLAGGPGARMMRAGGTVKSTWIVLVAALATGCLWDRHDDGGQFGEENGYGCVPVARTPLGDDEVSALGFAPRALFDLAVDAAVPFTYDDGSTTELTLVPEVTGPAELVDYEWSGDGATEMTAALGCPDRVELPVRLGFTTSDDGFREQVAMRLGAATPRPRRRLRHPHRIRGGFRPLELRGSRQRLRLRPGRSGRGILRFRPRRRAGRRVLRNRRRRGLRGTVCDRGVGGPRRSDLLPGRLRE